MSNTDLVRLGTLLCEVRMNLRFALRECEGKPAWKHADEADRLLYNAMLRVDRELEKAGLLRSEPTCTDAALADFVCSEDTIARAEADAEARDLNRLTGRNPHQCVTCGAVDCVCVKACLAAIAESGAA